MLRVAVIGLGSIGVGCARAVLAEAGLELVSLVDLDPRKLDRTLADLVNGRGQEAGAGPRVTNDLQAALHGVDVAIVATTSRFDEVAVLLRQLLERGVAVVSSCEEMIWPWYRHPDLAREIDACAQRHGRAVLGTGVNPGFAMDTLAVTLATMVRRVNGVRCVRRLDASLRRGQLQRKIGAGLAVNAFEQRATRGELGHSGLAESVAMLARGLGRDVAPGTVEETLEPVIADRPMPSSVGLIGPGDVAGVHHVAMWAGPGLRVELDLTMAVGLADPRDKIVLSGPVQLCLKIPGALPGDSATVAALLNHLHPIHHATPGLKTMLDMPPAGCANRDREGKAV